MPEYKHILWIDDEIELLKAHILYLEERGYRIKPITNGPDALKLARQERFDAALVDEIMPAMSGLEVIEELKRLKPHLPVIMVTKNEAEELMEQAIGRKVEAFLTKPVNPSQILSVLKSVLERRQISASELARRWANEFNELAQAVETANTWFDWIELHQRLSLWEIELDLWDEIQLQSMIKELRNEANRLFANWIDENYTIWIDSLKKPDHRPPLSMDFVDKWLVPLLKINLTQKTASPILFLVLDCLRLDQWLVIEPLISEFFNIKREGYYSILPSATPYARNSLFSGLTPAELERIYPDLWSKGDEDEASSNRFERHFLQKLLSRRGIELKPELRYIKVLELEEAAEFERHIQEYIRLPLTAMVYNFVDILIHTRQSVEILKEMIPDESALRSVTRSWFRHSSLYRIMRAYGEAGGTILLTSDHGAIRVKRGAQVIGDKQASASLRYKYGRNLKVEPKYSLRISEPNKWELPKRGVNTEYIFAREDYFFVYPTNYHHYLELFKDSFQHGGISLEEIILPVAILTGKGK